MPTKANHRPRIGVPWRTTKQERARDTRAYRDYLRAVTDAGGEPVKVSLLLPPAKLRRLAATLDAVVLPGSPADVNPQRYRGKPHNKTTQPDVHREETDIALLKDAFASAKPVLAICYGIQLLNVYLGGTLVQDIPSELAGNNAARGNAAAGKVMHDPDTLSAVHPVHFQDGRLAKLAGRATVRVNSSHHQSIRSLGRGLRVAAHAPDGVVEAVEWIGGPQWVVGVQWHPERMRRSTKGSGARPKAGAEGVALAGALFAELVSQAAAAAKKREGNLRSRGALHVKSESSR